MDETPDQNLDYHCLYCDYKSRTSFQIFIHECGGKTKAKQLKKQAIKLGQDIGVPVGVSQ